MIEIDDAIVVIKQRVYFKEHAIERRERQQVFHGQQITKQIGRCHISGEKTMIIPIHTGREPDSREKGTIVKPAVVGADVTKVCHTVNLVGKVAWITIEGGSDFALNGWSYGGIEFRDC